MAIIEFPHGGKKGEPPVPPPPDNEMAQRVTKIEHDVTDIKVVLGEIKSTLAHLATRADVEAVRGEVREVKGGLSGKLGLWQFVTLGVSMVGAGVALTGAVGAALIHWGPTIAAFGK